MRRRPPSAGPALLAGAASLVWLALSTGYAAAAAAPTDPIDLGGTPVTGGTGSTTPDQPTTLDPGLWTDTLGGSEARNAHHFTYDRRMRDSTVHVGVVGTPMSTDSDGLKVDVGVVGEDGELTSCGTGDDSTTSGVPQALLGAAAHVGPTSAEATDRPPCVSAGTLQIEVSRGYSSNTSELPIAIKVVEEARVDNPASLPEPADDTTFDLPTAGSAEALKGATSFDDAPALDPAAGGVTVSTTIPQGTEQLWRVPVQWGQQLVARVTADKPTEAELGERCCGVPLKVRILDPRRESFALTDDAADDQSPDGSYDDEEALDLVAGSRPLLYRNRFADHLPVVPGDYWVAVSAGPVDATSDLEPLDIPVELTVAVSGSVGGEPGYPGVVTSPDEGTQVGGYSADKPFLVADGVFSAVASGNPFVADDEDAGWLSGRRWAGLGLAALSTACLAGGVVRLRARR